MRRTWKSLFNEASPSTTVTGRCLPSGFLRNFPSFKFDRDQVDQRWPRPPSTKKLCRRAQGRVSLRGAPPWRMTRTQNPPRMVSASLPCGTNRKPSDQGPKHQQEGGNWIQATIIFRSPSGRRSQKSSALASLTGCRPAILNGLNFADCGD